MGWCNRYHLSTVFINGEAEEMEDTYKFLGVHLNNKLDGSNNTEAHCRKGQSRLFFLRRLRSLNMDTRLIWMF